MNMTLTRLLQTNLFRNLSAVSLHKVAQVAGSVVTVILIPRLFGAEDYGRFAFALSLAFLGQILGDFGTLEVMSRFAPTFEHGENSRLYMRTLAFKLLAGLGCGLITVMAAWLLSRWMRPAWALLIGLSVTLRIITWVPFQFALGLDRVGVWMAEQSWRHWLLLALLLLLLPPLGMSGALLALVLMEAIFLALGLWWTRDYWRGPELRLDWPYMRFYIGAGSGFFLANLAVIALDRSGPVLVETLTSQSAQTGYLNLAIGFFLLVFITLSQFARSLIPTLSRFYNRGQPDQMQAWLDHFIRYSWLIAWAGLGAIYALGDWTVPLLFGAEFGPVATVLKVIGLGLPLTALLAAANAVMTVTGRGGLKFGVSLAGLTIFFGAAVALIPAYGAAGAALALVMAVGVNLAGAIWFLRGDFRLRWRFLLLSGGPGTIALIFLESSLWPI